MLLNKLTLINQLMAEGEEDTAVLLARSPLPATVDTERDSPTLRLLGLTDADLAALAPAVAGGPDRTELTEAQAKALERTISQRWADLVTTWTRKH
ncbi:hypothetical protein [Actinocorallia sp. A-T 12471]|uniref:hypothetical protein n=1 Tax=Actinocorallia sp. A-T 12471 TaxID=3089813 RepID=UPI0029D2C157|nr:hypothetical protein [Actinocorallia sp. A-T 12471]MDX6740748.1 hypothetical protein [Actinocorallia sp. A-T 12471]